MTGGAAVQEADSIDLGESSCRDGNSEPERHALQLHQKKMNTWPVPVWIFISISAISVWESSTDAAISLTAGIIWYGWKR